MSETDQVIAVIIGSLLVVGVMCFRLGMLWERAFPKEPRW